MRMMNHLRNKISSLKKVICVQFEKNLFGPKNKSKFKMLLMMYLWCFCDKDQHRCFCDKDQHHFIKVINTNLHPSSERNPFLDKFLVKVLSKTTKTKNESHTSKYRVSDYDSFSKKKTENEALERFTKMFMKSKILDESFTVQYVL